MSKRRLIDPADLVGAAEIGDRLGVTKQAVTNWAARYSDFPAPLTELRLGRVWLWSEVAAWNDKRENGA